MGFFSEGYRIKITPQIKIVYDRSRGTLDFVRKNGKKLYRDGGGAFFIGRWRSKDSVLPYFRLVADVADLRLGKLEDPGGDAISISFLAKRKRRQS